MEAPEKIFVEVRHPISEELTELIGFESRSSDNEVEYIRADIMDEIIQTAEDHAYFAGKEKLREELLEWAKEKASDYKGTANIRRSFELMIRKIESL